jgi:phosphopantothenoylcysteine decarboxylase/phosphopantothenate--cysteine ligase
MKVLITAGATYERIDPVRFIGNYSTGKMGFALAETCAEHGFEVVLIAGKVNLQTQHAGIQRIDVESAEEMYNAVMENFTDCDIAIWCAAVADFTPEKVYSEKVKRGQDDLIIRLKPTKDIAAAAGKIKRENQILIGFALETNNEELNALSKMQRKNLDMIVLNSLKDSGAGFGCDTNKVTVFKKNGEKISLPLMSKKEVAEEVVKEIENISTFAPKKK